MSPENPEIPQTHRDDYQQDELKKIILDCIRSEQELPDEFIKNSTKETVQAALEEGLVERIKNGQWLSKKYAELTDAETWSNIKNRHQEEIQQGLVIRIKNGEDIATKFLELATEETLSKIKESSQEEIEQGIPIYIGRRQSILEIYLKLADENTLQSALKQSLFDSYKTGQILPASCLGLLSEDTFDDMRKNHQQEVREWITNIGKRNNFPEKYLEIATGDNLQLALELWLSRRIQAGQSIPKKYLDIVSEETLALMKENHKEEIEQGITIYVREGKNIPKYLLSLADNETMQAALRNAFAVYVDRGVNIPEYYLKLAAPETIQSAIRKTLVRHVEAGTSISPHYSKLAAPETVQSALREAFVSRMKVGAYLSHSYQSQITKESFQIISTENQANLQEGLVRCVQYDLDFPLDYSRLATEKTMQSALEQGLVWCIEMGRPLSAKYLRIATKETAQSALRQGFVEYIKKEISIPKQYLDLATDETLRSVLEQAFVECLQEGRDLNKKYMDLLVAGDNLQPTLQEGLIKKVQEGGHPNRKILNLASEETLLVFEKEPVLREAAFRLVESFFENPQEMEFEIRELLAEKDVDWIRRLVLDRTLLSVGVKIHTRSRELSAALSETRGFVAHGKETCFVANPVPNKFVLEIAIGALKRKVKDLDKETFFQACVPDRLDNESCGVATVAFLLTKENNVRYDKKVLQHNQNTAGLTIYDAGGSLVEKFYVPKANKEDDSKVSFKGRTDIVLCTSIEDIEKAHLILSLLVHASHEPQELKFKELGQRFVRDFTEILESQGRSDWLNHNFINANLEDVGKILIEIAQHREEISRMIKQYNTGVGLYAAETESESEENLEQIREQLESMKKNIDNSFWFKIKSLVDKYENLLYPDGMYIDALSGEYY